MAKYITKEGIFETENQNEIPWDKLHSPDENIPAFQNEFNGIKEWYYEGKLHRLSGPAAIGVFGDKWFYLNGIEYEFVNWIKNHPNLDFYLEANGYKTNEEKAIWKLKNL